MNILQNENFIYVSNSVCMAEKKNTKIYQRRFIGDKRHNIKEKRYGLGALPFEYIRKAMERQKITFNNEK